MLEPDGTRCIVEAIVSLARRLGLQTVAEGVENENQLAVLRAIGCDLVQGFFFAGPLSAIDAACLLWKETISGPGSTVPVESIPPASVHDISIPAPALGRHQRRRRN
jgi:predicted signal transduction protein with EAL and GGDEF domain